MKKRQLDKQTNKQKRNNDGLKKKKKTKNVLGIIYGRIEKLKKRAIAEK